MKQQYKQGNNGNGTKEPTIRIRTFDWDHAPVTQEKISDLVFDWDIYPRKEIDHHSVVQQYVKALEAGVKFPTVKIGLFQGKKIIVDGAHRVRAHSYLKRDTVECSSLPIEGKADLFAETVRLNSSHGKRFTNVELQDNIKRLRQYKFNIKDISSIVHVPASEIYREAAAPIAVLTLPSGKRIGIGGNATIPDAPDMVKLKDSLKLCDRMAREQRIPIQNAETMSLLIKAYLALGKVLSNT